MPILRMLDACDSDHQEKIEHLFGINHCRCQLWSYGLFRSGQFAQWSNLVSCNAQGMQEFLHLDDFKLGEYFEICLWISVKTTFVNTLESLLSRKISTKMLNFSERKHNPLEEKKSSNGRIDVVN